MKSTQFLVAAAAFVALAGCQSTRHQGTVVKHRVDRTSAEARAAAVSEKADVVGEVAFDKGSSVLNETAKTKLNSLVDQASTNRKIDKVQVMSWADQEYPENDPGKLSKAQRELASERVKAIARYLKDYSKNKHDNRVNVDSFNMAERPGALSKMFNTADARVKRNMESAGLPTNDGQWKPNAKASKSIIMIMTE